MAELDNCGYWKYLGESDVPKAEGKIKPIDPEQLWPGVEPINTEASESHSVPRILTRAEKGQALTHLEMDFNLASLFHKLNTSSVGAPWDEEELDENSDAYFNLHKPSREEEMKGMFATFSYAPVVNGTGSVIQNAFQTIKIQHSTDEIRYKLSNECIPGTLDIAEDFHVTGSSFIAGNSYLSGSTFITGNLSVVQDTQTNTLYVTSSSIFGGDLRAEGTSSFRGDVYVVGNLYVNGVLFGNLSQKAYKTSDYAEPINRKGIQVEERPSGSLIDPQIPSSSLFASSPVTVSEKDYYTKAEVDQMLADLRIELLAEIHGQTQK